MSAFGLDLNNTWARLSRLTQVGIGEDVGLFTADREWLNAGIDPDSMGLLHQSPALRASVKPGELVEIPFFDDLLIDLHVRHTVRVLRIPPGSIEDHPEVVVEGDFEDDHPAEWVDQLSLNMRGVLVIAPQGHEAFSDISTWMDTWRLGIVGVARRMTSEGIGII